MILTGILDLIFILITSILLSTNNSIEKRKLSSVLLSGIFLFFEILIGSLWLVNFVVTYFLHM